MPRILKHPEVRRTEILDEAFRIFLQRGYENTSLNEVISEAGLSKGMFYHHFESKEALLLALFERASDEIYDMLRPVLAEEGLDALERLQKVFDGCAALTLAQAQSTRPVLTALLKPESTQLYDGMWRAWMERFRPVLASIIQDGVAEGTFQTFDPDGVAQMTLEHAIGTKDLIGFGLVARSMEQRNAAAERLSMRLRLHALALSRILGLQDHSLTIGEGKFAHRLFELLNPKRSSGKKGKKTTHKAKGPAQRRIAD